MTTTVPSMEKAITLLHSKIPDSKIMVGGAVLTSEYAKMINADYYARDGMDAVKLAKEFYGSK